MKVLIVAPKSIHTINYCSLIGNNIDSLYFLGEEIFDVPFSKKSFKVNVRTLNPFRIKSVISKIKEIIKEVKPDIIHIHQINRFAFFTVKAVAGLKIPIVTTAWGSDVLLVPQKNILYRNMVKRVLLDSAFVTGDSYDMLNSMQNLHANPLKYKMLQYGIESVKSITKEKIIYSNRLHESLYNINLIIKDFYDFSQSHIDWKLIIAGTGSLTDELKRQVKELKIENKVEFVGWLKGDDNRKYFSKSSMFVSIPKSDGTSVSLLEAMSGNCIPIVSDIAVTREWITHNKNGIIRNIKENPFEAALRINQEECFTINQSIISNNATRESSLMKFLEIYNNSIKPQTNN